MEKIIGYKQAKTLLLNGAKVQECPRIRSGNVAYIRDTDGKLAGRIRADAWEKLRKECAHVETICYGVRNQSRQHIWGVGAEWVKFVGIANPSVSASRGI